MQFQHITELISARDLHQHLLFVSLKASYYCSFSSISHLLEQGFDELVVIPGDQSAGRVCLVIDCLDLPYLGCPHCSNKYFADHWYFLWNSVMKQGCNSDLLILNAVLGAGHDNDDDENNNQNNKFIKS